MGEHQRGHSRPRRVSRSSLPASELNGKEGVDGSSPSEGFEKVPANGISCCLRGGIEAPFGVTTAGRDYVRGLCWEAVARFCRREGRRLSMRIERSSVRSTTAQNLSIKESRHSISDPESAQESRGRNNAFIRESRSSTGAARCRAGSRNPEIVINIRMGYRPTIGESTT